MHILASFDIFNASKEIKRGTANRYGKRPSPCLSLQGATENDKSECGYSYMLMTNLWVYVRWEYQSEDSQVEDMLVRGSWNRETSAGMRWRNLPLIKNSEISLEVKRGIENLASSPEMIKEKEEENWRPTRNSGMKSY